MVDDVARKLVGTLYAGTPVPHGCRVNHARGMLVRGRFLPAGGARPLSRAGVFVEGESEVLARFSSSTGDPDLAENDAMADPRGLAVAIGDDLVLVGHSVEAFPARSSDEFLAFLEALNVQQEEPERLERHLREHEAAHRFVEAKADRPASFAALRYHMLHLFRLDAADGRSTLGRLSVVGERAAGASAAPAGADYLSRELHDRLAAGEVRFVLEFTRWRKGDPIDDMAGPWTGHRDAVALGTLVLDRPAEDQAAQKRILFDPSRLPDGMAFAGEAMIEARLRAYRIAFDRRLGKPVAHA